MSVRDQVLAAVAKSTAPGPVPANLTPALNAIAKPEVFVNGCVLSWRDVAQPDCVSGDTSSPTTVALVGDSHAAMWQPALEPVARERHWRLQTMSKVLCPFLDLPTNSPYLGRKFTECDEWRGEVMARLHKEISEILDSSEVQKLFAAEGADVVHMSTAQFGAYMTSEIDKWGRVVKQAGIKAQ